MAKVKNLDQLTEAEWRVMRIVWELETCSARDVYTIAMEKYGWARTTVKSFLSLLVDKGYLSTRQEGNRYIYKPRRSLLQSLYQAADSLLDKTMDGSEGSLVAYMVKQSRMNEKELNALRDLIDSVETVEEDEKN